MMDSIEIVKKSPAENIRSSTTKNILYLCNPQSQGSLTRPGRSGQQQRPPGHFTTTDQIDDETACLPGFFLTHEAGTDGIGLARCGV